jgi:hypothetical protein
MDVKQMAEMMFSNWMLGLAMVYLVYTSKYYKLLKIDKEALLRFAKFLVFLTASRYVYLTYIAPDASIASIKEITGMIPWQTVPGVFWEDACHALPLVVMEKMFKLKTWFKYARLPLLCAMSFFFGLGHSYEGMGAVLMMMCYIPITMRLGKKYGFGTIMLCHVAYDMCTLLSFKFILGI